MYFVNIYYIFIYVIIYWFIYYLLLSYVVMVLVIAFHKNVLNPNFSPHSSFTQSIVVAPTPKMLAKEKVINSMSYKGNGNGPLLKHGMSFKDPGLDKNFFVSLSDDHEYVAFICKDNYDIKFIFPPNSCAKFYSFSIYKDYETMCHNYLYIEKIKYDHTDDIPVKNIEEFVNESGVFFFKNVKKEIIVPFEFNLEPVLEPKNINDSNEGFIMLNDKLINCKEPIYISQVSEPKDYASSLSIKIHDEILENKFVIDLFEYLF